jgi:DNA repair exonuclease SbcCD ATPase subunit
LTAGAVPGAETVGPAYAIDPILDAGLDRPPGGQKPRHKPANPAASAKVDSRQQAVEQERRTEGMSNGAAIGALLGTVIGAAVSNDHGQGAAVGGGLGTLIGTGIGGAHAEGVNQQTREIAAEQDELVEARKLAQARHQQYQVAARAAEDESRAQAARLAAIQEQLQSGQSTYQDLKKEIENTRAQERKVRAQIAGITGDIERATAQGGLEAEVAKLREQRANLAAVEQRLRAASKSADMTLGGGQ